MNIVVVTPYDSANFGAYLQAYCLKLSLEKLGHSVFHVPTRDATYVRNLYYREKPISKRDRLFPWMFREQMEFGIKKLELFMQDQTHFKIADLLKEADLYILGSDEIWNINKEVFRKPLFWGRGMSPVISYATSIGDAKIEEYDKYPEIINDLRRLNVALVRDERTLSLVNKYSKTPAKIVCDPTMLLQVTEYGEEFNDSYLKENKCLLVYAYSLNRKQQNAIKIYARKNGFKIVSCCFRHNWSDHHCNCRPLQFSSLIRQCEAVFTTTFHGSIFCIINHANFVSLPTSPKTVQLLEYFKLTERMISNDQFDSDALHKILSGDKIKYDEVESILQDYRKNSWDALNESINQSVNEKKEKFNYQICPSDECTGCFACMNKCPRDAIECVTDIYGRTLPQINIEKCIQCGQCKDVCPQINPVKLSNQIHCYAAQRSEESKRIQSASGGIGAILTEYFLQNNDVVYGAVVSEDGVVIHKRADDLKMGEKFRKSKYVQSYIGYVYRDVQDQLKRGKKVLFTGTPCQIAGLKNYLGHEYDDLYCVDIICHGTPPMQYLKEHIRTVTGGQAVDEITFRGGKKDYYLTLKNADMILYSRDRFHDKYFYAFLNGINNRENCFTCCYTRKERSGDLTIGDFWGLDRSTLKTKQTGNVSVILVNSKKGERLFHFVSKSLVYEERSVDEAIEGNPQLRRSSIRHKSRSKFLRVYSKEQDFNRTNEQIGVKKEMAIINFKRSKGWTLVRKLKKVLIGKR